MREHAADDLLRRADAVRGAARRRRRSSTRLDARCACSTSAGEALPRARRRALARALRHATSSTASARRRCCTSSSRTAPATCATARPASPCPATSSSSRGDDGEPVADGEEGVALGARPDGVRRLLEQRASAASRRSTARGRAPAIATCATRDGYYTYCGPRRRHAQGRRHLGVAVRGRVGARRARRGARGRGRRPRRRRRARQAEGVRRAQGRRRARATALADELKAFVKARLAPYKYPRWIEFVARAAEDGDRQDPALQAARLMIALVAGGRRLEARLARTAARRRADARVPPRGARLRRAAGATSPRALARGDRASASLVYSRAGYGAIDPVAAAAPAAVHARRGARASCRRCSRPRGVASAVARRPQRRRVDRAHRGRRRGRRAAPRGLVLDRAARVRRGRLGRRAIAQRARRVRPTATCASGSRATTATTSTARSGAGTAPGSIPDSASGTSRSICRRSPCRRWSSKATTIRTARSRRSTRSRAGVRGPCDVLPLEGGGHAPWKERPAEVREAIRAFVAQTSTAGASATDDARR